MAKRNQIVDKGEWAAVIKAQDETSKVVLKEEEDLQKQSKIRYKEELDKQLQYKNKVNKGEFSEKQQEMSFLVAQGLAMRNFESKKKQEDKSYLQIFMNDNQNDQLKRTKLEQKNLKYQKALEQQRIQTVQEELEKQHKKELEFKNNRVKMEQEELKRLNAERIRQATINDLEKFKDKAMINSQIEEMKSMEASYKVFYEKRMQNMEKKLKNFQPIMESNQNKQDFINKRNREWEKVNLEKQMIRAQTEETKKIRDAFDLKCTLEKQIEDKQKGKEQEVIEYKKDQIAAKSRAREEELERQLERDRKQKDREQLNLAYSKQLEERKKQDMQSVLMDPREKKFHEGILRDLNDHKLLAFPGVPGVHSTESPIKRSYNLIYASPNEKKLDTSLVSKKTSKTPPPFFDISASYELNLTKRNYNFPDPLKHDPITNPIGSILPRVLPGERIVKGFQSHSRLAQAGNALFKYN